MFHDNEKQQDGGDYLNRETLTMPDINLITRPLDIVYNNSKSYTDLQLPISSHKEIMKSIDHLVELQELLFDQCLPDKKYYSESTQTENCNNTSQLTSKSLPPPMNFISVLKCKHNLQQSEKNDLEIYEPVTDLSINAYNLYSNKINNINNFESTKFNKSDVENCDEEVNLPNINHIESKNCLNISKSSLIDETMKPKSNNLFSTEIIENNNCEDKIDIINNDKLLTKLNNYDFDLMTKNNCCNLNNLHNTYINLKFDENNSNNKSLHCVSNKLTK